MRDVMLSIDGLTLNLKTQELIMASGCCIRLTKMETRLLAEFMKYPGQLVPRAQLMAQVWKTNYLGDTRTLDVHISWVRKKIHTGTAHTWQIRTVRGQGYQLVNGCH